MYKGYLKGNGKHAAQKFKDGEKLLTYNGARKHESFVGILEDDFIMVDIDDIEESRLLLKIVKKLNVQCSVLQTDNGHHYYFKGYDLTSNKIKWFTPLGIKADFKLGIKQTADPLRIDGKTRKWVYKSETHQTMPKWLMPTSRKENGLAKLEDGDGRNQELFNYILKLQSVGMNKEEIRETIRLINDFILKEPLPKDEIEIILRDESFMKESFFVKGTFLHDKFAKFLIAEHHIITIMDVLHIYKDGVYSDKLTDIEKAMIKHLPALTKARRQEVLSYIQLEAKEKPLAPVNFVAVKNGIVNIDTWKLQEFDPHIVIKNKIPVAYIKNSYYEITDKTLNKIANHDIQLRKILDEIFGYILLRRNEYGKAFILTGDGSNGKSSYLKIVRKLAGDENTSSLDLKELNQRFKTAELFGKLANIGDDISGEYIKDNSEFKKLATGDTINAERKGRDPFDFSNYSKLIFSANRMPRINDTSNGLLRRLLMVPFKAKFSVEDEDYDPFIQDKLLSDESMQYVLQLAFSGLKRLMKNKKFTSSKVVQKEADKYAEQNNPVIGFLNEQEPKLENEVAADVYRQYTVWCAENGFQPIANNNFSREVGKLKKLTTKVKKMNGKNKRIFIKNVD